jgi:hypothetical protein
MSGKNAAQVERPGRLKKILAATYFPLASIIGSSGLNGRVRNENGCDPTDMTTRKRLIVQ